MTTSTPSAAPMVELHDVTRVFTQGGTEIRPVDGLSLIVRTGEFVSLMGPSGSGKSTLLNLLCGIDRATSGSVKVAGVDVGTLGRSQLARWRNQHLGVIFQQYHLVPVLTAFENVELPLRLRKLSRKERRQRVQVAIDAVGLTDRATHLPGQLSGGQQQRVAIARAFVTDPDLILADEPTGNLDRTSVTGALKLLERLHTEFGKTLLMVTHDPAAARVAQRTLHLDQGRIREDATSTTLAVTP
ncbi:MAG: ABC transporter ATP-binding protein [Planctomycetota bacterium]